MYRATLRIEYLDEIMSELIHDYLASEILTDALNIFLSMFERDGTFKSQFMNEDDVEEYCRESYAKIEDIPLDEIDDNFPFVIGMLVTSFLDNICGFYGHPPTHPMNLDTFLAMLNLYYLREEAILVKYHNYDSYNSVLKLIIW